MTAIEPGEPLPKQARGEHWWEPRNLPNGTSWEQCVYCGTSAHDSDARHQHNLDGCPVHVVMFPPMQAGQFPTEDMA